MEHHIAPHGTEEMEQCATLCAECERICLETVTHCLEKGGRHAQMDHIRTMLDCADICGVSARYLSRNSPHHVQTCAVCSELCIACAEQCERMGDDEVMRECAEVCRRCADSCQRMSRMAA